MTQTAAIVGGGVIGGGWAARFLLNGWNVQVFDPDPEAERHAAEIAAPVHDEGLRQALEALGRNVLSRRKP